MLAAKPAPRSDPRRAARGRDRLRVGGTCCERLDGASPPIRASGGRRSPRRSPKSTATRIKVTSTVTP